MERTKLKDRILPPYTKGEEIMNMVTHIVGGAMGIVALVLCVVMAAINSNVYGVVSGAIFGATMIILYTMSSIYHGLKPHLTAKKVFQVIDHCSIFILIAGTYTPIVLCTVREASLALGWGYFGVVWAVAILGIVLNAIDLKKYDRFSLICYLVLGWCIIFSIKTVATGIGFGGMMFLVSGGIAYTLGAVFYVIGKKKNTKYIHSVFHLFVDLGSFLHFMCILLYVM
ncbi:MAG: hemolysin III family protein [Clostridia bacterium]|nr:hemolysin III family protein [Clostridia bacterium]